MKHIYVVRHAESVINAGSANPAIGGDWKDLSAVGQEQAVALVNTINEAEIVPKKIISSPMLRAVRTAEPLAKRYSLSIETIDEFREIDYLREPNSKNKDFTSRQKQKLRFWQKSEDDFNYKDGGKLSKADSFGGFLKRAKSCISLLTDFENDTFVFTHHIIMMAIQMLIEGQSEKKIFEEIRSKERGSVKYQIANTQTMLITELNKKPRIIDLDVFTKS